LTTAYFAPSAWLPEGWASDVRIAVGEDGAIATIETGASAGDAERLHGPVVPGMVDVHSHAFQRAMAGLAERAGPAGDNFWSWREIMYRFLANLRPADVEAIATQLYVELLKHGYTSVVEFHYLHNDPTGALYENHGELAERIVEAAGSAGIGLTLLPVLYQTGDFGGRPHTDGQKRFVMPTDAFLAMVDRLVHRHRRDAQVRVGIAPHSLRAVPPDVLREALSAIAALDRSAPIHIHAAEQTKEVENCVAWSGKRPVEWLLEHAGVDARWCLVHCTHLSDDEIRALAGSGAVAGLCPTTEANLGDGVFRLPEYLRAGGRLAIGSDSNVCVSPVEELRWMEYAQRLVHRARNLTETRIGASTGVFLYARALAGGAQASGRQVGALAVGRRADLVVLDPDHPALLDRREDGLIDSWLFSGNATPVRDVIVGGIAVVRDGRHVHEHQAAADYAAAVRRLGA
jgi:formimidoylglutamate deiminase